MRVLLLLLSLTLAACLDWPEELLNPDGAGPGPDATEKDAKVKPGDQKVQPKDQKPGDQKMPPKDQKPGDQKTPPKDQKPGDQNMPPRDQKVPPKDQSTVSLKDDGQTCSGDNDCYSGHCSDGVCCDRACTGSCLSCMTTGKVGQCVPVGRGGKPPKGKTCSASSGSSCGADGTCDGAGKCNKWSGNVCKQGTCMTCAQPGAKGRCVLVTAGNKPPAKKACPSSPPCGADGRCNGKGKCRGAALAGTSCDVTSCAGGKLNTLACNGSGGCNKATSSCGAYTCQPGGKSCYGRCTKNSHCAAGKSCAAQQCK